MIKTTLLAYLKKKPLHQRNTPSFLRLHFHYLLIIKEKAGIYSFFFFFSKVILRNVSW
jgi:hypothetical protein